MTLIELTLAAQDESDGQKVLIHKDDIRGALPFKMFKEKVPDLMKGEKPREVTSIVLPYGRQIVSESFEDIKKLVNGE